jgi:lysine decarboxylase
LRTAPGAVAVLTTDPQYVGTYGDPASVAEVAHRHGIPLVVDAAWGGHFGFHPALPLHALAGGADALVMSVHKALTALNQGALLLARTERLDRARLDAAVEATATTSPSGAILASIDYARALVEHRGRDLLAPVLDAVASARDRLADVEGLTVVRGEGVDPMKLVVVLDGTGADGWVVEADLIAAGSPVELADRDTVIAMVTLADRPGDIEAFADLLAATVERRRGIPRRLVPAAAYTVGPVQVMTPREAFFAPHRTVDAAAAVGRVSAELVAPYPPGIPVLAPGETVTREALDALALAQRHGTRIAYAADPTLATLRVVA